MVPYMMSSNGFGSGFALFFVFHILSVLIFSFGILFLVFWAFKSLSGQDLWKWGWIFVVSAIILCLLSVIISPVRSIGFRSGFDGMKMKWSGGCSADASTIMPMMNAGRGTIGAADEEELKKDLEAGKSLYEKVLSKRMKCAGLTDEDFELIGEYRMSEVAGADHLQMNMMMEQRMGEQFEEQMHAMMGRSSVNCLQATAK